jgi:hypothetical protein
VISVDCSPLQESPQAKWHLGFHSDTINDIVGARVTYERSDSGVGRRNPQPSSRPSRRAPCTVPFNQWFIDAVCTPLKIILQKGTYKKIIVLFHDLYGTGGSMAMSHLFELSIPDGYHIIKEHLSQHVWKFGFGTCQGRCRICFSDQAKRMRAVAEQQAKTVMAVNCFDPLQRPRVCNTLSLPLHTRSLYLPIPAKCVTSTRDLNFNTPGVSEAARPRETRCTYQFGCG